MPKITKSELYDFSQPVYVLRKNTTGEYLTKFHSSSLGFYKDRDRAIEIEDRLEALAMKEYLLRKKNYSVCRIEESFRHLKPRKSKNQLPKSANNKKPKLEAIKQELLERYAIH